VGDLLAEAQRTGDSAAAAADAEGSAHGASSKQQASEANEASADGSAHDAPGEPLALGVGAAAAATKVLANNMLGKEAQAQRGDMATKDEWPADGALEGVDDGALVGVGAAAAAELATRAPARDGEAVTEACCLTTGCW
jgi:hypothetical protein